MVQLVFLLTNFFITLYATMLLFQYNRDCLIALPFYIKNWSEISLSKIYFFLLKHINPVN